jgi:Fic family protein
VPAPLPRAMELSPPVVLALDRASHALGALVGVGSLLADPSLLTSPYMLREAVHSVRVGGTWSTVGEVYAAEVGQTEVFRGPPDRPVVERVREVRNHMQAHALGISRLRGRRPLDLRLIRELHERLLRGIRGGESSAGGFRGGQIFVGWSGGAIEEGTYVPPPPRQMREALRDLERFLREDGLPPLVQAALMHYQLEAIMPFDEGNDCVGRLLIPLLLRRRGTLPLPLLCLSAHFERTSGELYELSTRVSTHGDWDAWLRYFLDGVHAQASAAAKDAKRLIELRARCRARVLASTKGRPAALRLADALFSTPYLTAAGVARRLEVSDPTARAAISDLLRAGILREMTGRQWGKVYLAPEVLDALRGRRARRAAVG